MLTLAWHEVRGKRGRHLKGVDRQTVKEIERAGAAPFLRYLRDELVTGTYRPARCRKDTCNGRYVLIQTVKDQVVGTALRLVLEAVVDPTFHEHTYGYRRFRSQGDCIRAVASNARAGDYVVRLDIERWFESIAHKDVLRELLRHVTDPWVRSLVREFLRSDATAGKGLPTGTTLAPLLANLTMTPVDFLFPNNRIPARQPAGSSEARASSKLAAVTANPVEEQQNHCLLPGNSWPGRQMDLASVRYFRYADDIVVLVHGGQAQAKDNLDAISDALEQRGLRLNTRKTTVNSVEEGFDFLGTRISWKEDLDRVQIRPSAAAMAKLTSALSLVANGGLDRTWDDFETELSSTFQRHTEYLRKVGADLTDVFAAAHQIATGWAQAKYIDRPC
jgi:RNA-directed DNA polymerase